MIAIAVFTILLAILVPNFVSARRQGQMRACADTEKQIRIALELYARDHDDLYPLAVQPLVGPYLKVLPTCPASGQAYDYEGHVNPDRFTVLCAAGHFGSPGYPRLTALRGLRTRP
ncbi:MAG: type II secretion system protein [Armatimonadetes bacterium]|nr:type II secretion system protein [Armatimonadota bacterium]